MSIVFTYLVAVHAAELVGEDASRVPALELLPSVRHRLPRELGHCLPKLLDVRRAELLHRVLLLRRSPAQHSSAPA